MHTPRSRLLSPILEVFTKSFPFPISGMKLFSTQASREDVESPEAAFSKGRWGCVKALIGNIITGGAVYNNLYNVL